MIYSISNLPKRRGLLINQGTVNSSRGKYVVVNPVTVVAQGHLRPLYFDRREY
jgi:hypothetical protein